MSPVELFYIGFDFSPILPPGVGITEVGVSCFTNTNPANPSSGLTFSTPVTRGRQIWATVTGGQPGTDYKIRWEVTDTIGNQWLRTALMLCAYSS